MGTPHDDNEKGLLANLALLACITLVSVGLLFATGSSGARADIVQTSAVISVCGNGIVDPGEVCDDGAGNNTGAYGSTTAQRVCEPGCGGYGPYCGDGILQVRFGEQCDNGALNSNSGLCSPTCESIPAAPPSTPTRVLGSTPFVPGATPGSIPASTETRVILRGKAFPNSDVTILLDGQPLGIVRADTNADFLFDTTSISPGTETLSFWAKDASGVSSLTTSVVFDVVQSAVTTVNNILIPPTLSVSDQKIAPGALLTLFGQSVPTAKVLTVLDTGTTNTFNSTADQTGNWALQLDTSSLTQGFHSAKASFSFATSSISGFGKSVNFFIGTEIPTGGLTPDLNGDGKVNLIDFSIFLLSWNSHDVRSDFNQDGIVNLADFSIMLFDWTG